MSREIQEIINKVKTLEPHESAVLATVVDVVGSSYRLPGARMLILANGETYGTVSGGCLEADVMERAKQVLKTGKPQVITYDTRANEDSVFSLNMGCNGVIRVLLEAINNESFLVRVLQIASENGDPQMIATLISANDTSDVRLGGRFFYDPVEQFYFKNLPSFLEKSRELSDDCEKFLDSDTTVFIKKYKTEQGEFEFLFENIKPPLSLVIFGAGADAVPLSAFAKDLGWSITIVDHRAAFAAKERFPAASNIIVSRPENLNGSSIFSDNTVAVVMTHNYAHDKELLRRLLKTPISYIGALGPKRRTESILHELREAGERFSKQDLGKLYAPVGLDIGAKTPEGIALSIVAEIQAVLAERKGGFLRNRVGSIYKRQNHLR